MELKSSHNELAVNILKQIEKAIEKIQERTKDINHVNDFITSSSGMEKLDATCMLLIAIGESIKGFDKVTNIIKRQIHTMERHHGSKGYYRTSLFRH
jgi:uncharacterized protein with HEPN domain